MDSINEWEKGSLETSDNPSHLREYCPINPNWSEKIITKHSQGLSSNSGKTRTYFAAPDFVYNRVSLPNSKKMQTQIYRGFLTHQYSVFCDPVPSLLNWQLKQYMIIITYFIFAYLLLNPCLIYAAGDSKFEMRISRIFVFNFGSTDLHWTLNSEYHLPQCEFKDSTFLSFA